MTAATILGFLLLCVSWTAGWVVFLRWVTRDPKCRGGRHVFEQRFCGMRVRPDGGRDLEVTEMCQLCLFKQRRWL